MNEDVMKFEFQTDSSNYDVLEDGVKKAKNTKGAILEIGLRAGGGTAFMIRGMEDSGQKEKPLFAIDPYGNIEYYRDEIFKTGRCDYTNTMRNETLVKLYDITNRMKINFYFFNMEDTEFFKRYRGGVPIYLNKKEIVNLYSFVHFDGPHTIAALNEEVKFFDERSNIGAVFVFDDVTMYQHDVLHEYLSKRGWECYVKTERKWAYQKCSHCSDPWETLKIPTEKHYEFHI